MSYEDIRNSVMETPETKETDVENIISKIGKKNKNKYKHLIFVLSYYIWKQV